MSDGVGGAIRCPAQPVPPTTRVSQMRVGWIAWYWAPAAAVEPPYQPLASMITLIDPAALKTHSDVLCPPGVDGPSWTMTRFAATSPAERLMLENRGPVFPLYGHWPVDVVAERLRKVRALPATPVRLTTTADAVPSAGTISDPIPIPVTLTSIAAPGPRMPCALHAGVGD